MYNRIRPTNPQQLTCSFLAEVRVRIYTSTAENANYLSTVSQNEALKSFEQNWVKEHLKILDHNLR
jgi:hypothetical protein